MISEDIEFLIGEYRARHWAFDVSGKISEDETELRLRWKSDDADTVAVMRMTEDIYERADEQLFSWWHEFIEEYE